MLNYTIGAVKKKKSTAKKSKATKTKLASGKPRIKSASTPSKFKSYKVTSTCSTAGSDLKTKKSSSAGGVLALCRASVKKLNVTAKALKKFGVTRGRLSR